MKIKEGKKDINYWKNNAEDDYYKTPISVIHYISKLENKVNNVVLDDVIKCANCDEGESKMYCKKCYDEAWEINPC